MDKEKEEWKSLNFLGYPNYEVSTLGNVKSLNYLRTGKEKILKENKDTLGYCRIGLCKNGKKKTFLVHQLVALTFLENPNNLPCVNHKDENPSNNHVDNLEFCNHTYNMNYGTIIERKSKSMKGKMSGENNPMYGKISPRRKPILQFSLSGEFIKEWESATQASKELNMNGGDICNCCRDKQKTAYSFLWKYKE